MAKKFSMFGDGFVLELGLLRAVVPPLCLYAEDAYRLPLVPLLAQSEIALLAVQNMIVTHDVEVRPGDSPLDWHIFRTARFIYAFFQFYHNFCISSYHHPIKGIPFAVVAMIQQLQCLTSDPRISTFDSNVPEDMYDADMNSERRVAESAFLMRLQVLTIHEGLAESKDLFELEKIGVVS
jgi:hypothetical protein